MMTIFATLMTPSKSDFRRRLLALCVTCGILLGANGNVYINGYKLDGDAEGDGWSFKNKTLTISKRDGEFKLAGGDNIHFITVCVGNCATLTLGDNISGLKMTGYITFESGVDCNVVLSGKPVQLSNAKEEHVVIVKERAKVSLSGTSSLEPLDHNTKNRCVWVQGAGTLVMNSGKISGFDMSSTGCGGAIFNEGTFTMEGGTISSNSASQGGAIFNEGTFTMNGGTISSNSASQGGAIYNRGTTRIYCGWMLEVSTITMEGRTISSNSASQGGAIYNRGTTHIYGGRLVDNTAANGYGGCCYDAHDCHTYIYGGYFSGNKAPSGQGNVYVGEALSKYGSLYGGVFTADPMSDCESCNGLALMDGVTVTKVGDYYVVGGDMAYADGILTAGRYYFCPVAQLYVDLGIISRADSSVSGETLPDDRLVAWRLKTKRQMVDCTTWAEVRSNLNQGNGVTVAQSMTAPADGGSVTVPAGAKLTLDLGDSTITSQPTGPLFTLDQAGAALTVRGDGRIVNGVADEAAHNGGCFNVTAGSLEIAGGTYEGFRVGTGCHGGCVYVGSGASFALTGGVISNCWAGGAGGAVASRGTCRVAYGLLTRNGAAQFGGALAALDGAAEVSGGEFDANGAAVGHAAPTNGAAVAAVDAARLTLKGGNYHDNITAAADDKGSGAAVYLRLNAAGSAKILGGLFGPNRAGSGAETRSVLVDTAAGAGTVAVHGCFLYGQDPQTLGDYLDAASECVAVRTNWWTVALRGTVQITTERVTEGTFTFDPLGEACYVEQQLVPGGGRSIYTPGTGGGLDTWELSSNLADVLYYEGQCVLADDTTPSGRHLFRTYLTTADENVTSATNHVVVRLDDYGYYAGLTPLDVGGFLDAHGEAFLAIDIYTENGKTLVQREARQRIGAVPYAIRADRVDSAKFAAFSAESLTVSQSARIGTLAVTSSLIVATTATVTNDWVNSEGRVEKVTIDNLQVNGAGTSLLEPLDGMSSELSVRKGWSVLASSTTGTIREQDGLVTATLDCAHDGLLFVACTTTGDATLALKIDRSGTLAAQEPLVDRADISAADGVPLDLSAVVVRGDRMTVSAKAAGEGSGTVLYRYITFGDVREEK